MADGKYDFILNPGTKKGKLPKVSGGGGGIPKPAIIAIMVLGAVSVIVLGIILINSLFFGSPYDRQALGGVGRQQARILQAAELGVDDAQSQEARNLATTIRVSLVGDQAPLLEALTARDITVSTADDPEVEEKFTAAKQANRFDEELINYLQTELDSYVNNLEAAVDSTDDTALKQVLADQYRNAQLLAGQTEDNQ